MSTRVIGTRLPEVLMSCQSHCTKALWDVKCWHLPTPKFWDVRGNSLPSYFGGLPSFALTFTYSISIKVTGKSYFQMKTRRVSFRRCHDSPFSARLRCF